MTVHFVFRSHYDGPLSKRRRVFADASIVAWFERAFRESGADPRGWAATELGGRVYGFASVLEHAKAKDLAIPTSWQELGALLAEHLYVEGEVVTTAHTVRANTNDDEVDLPYFFFDDVFAAAHPDRVAWLLHDDPILPEGGSEGGFVPPVRCAEIGRRAGGQGATYATYACLLTFYDSSSVPGEGPHVFPGVRLGEFARHLVSVEPGEEAWPLELRVLRAMVSSAEPSLAPALIASAAFPLDYVGSSLLHSQFATGPHTSARAELAEVAKGHVPAGDRRRDIVSVGDHRAELLLHASDVFGYQQWIFFDDLWAAAHPALAASLLRYAATWDPLDVGPEGGP